jgi:hypothetical protein
MCVMLKLKLQVSINMSTQQIRPYERTFTSYCLAIRRARG